MKKLVLLFTGLLMGLTTVSAAKKITATPGEDLFTRYRYAQPIMFVERGVEFLIFPDGTFDFNTNINDSYFRTQSNTRRTSINATSGAPGTRVKYSRSRRSPQGILITHDRDGKVRRIGNVFINYDRRGKIKRAGTIYMQYNRGNGRLKQVGGLRVNYNHWGEIVHTSGVVNAFNSHMNFGHSHHGQICFAEHDDFGWNDFEDNDFVTEEDFYYYKQNGKKEKKKKRK